MNSFYSLFKYQSFNNFRSNKSFKIISFLKNKYSFNNKYNHNSCSNHLKLFHALNGNSIVSIWTNSISKSLDIISFFFSTHQKLREKEAVILFSKMSLDSISRSLKNFLEEESKTNVDHAANWQKLRRDFLDCVNKKVVLEPTLEITKLLKKVQQTNGFGNIFTDVHINKVFPAMKFKFHLVKTPNEPSKAIKIRAPSYAAPKSARPRSIDTPSLTLKPRDTGPKTSRFKTVRIDPDNKEPMKPFPDELPPAPPKITDLIPTLKVDENTEKLLEEASTPRKRWINGFTLNNERDAIKYVAAVDSKHDFLQFHFGTNEKTDHFKFQVENQLRGRAGENFHTVTKRGVFGAETTGHSEFTDLHKYVENKTQFEMLQPISLFSQFKVYKYYNYWRLKTIRKLFLKRLHCFADACWSSKPQYPQVVYNFRVHLLSLREMVLFPYKTVDGELEFNALSRTLSEARDNTYRLISKVSSEIRVILNNLSKQLNEHYEFITSPRVTDYLEMKKIPAELFMASKMPFKHSQSIVEARELKIKHEKEVALAKMDLEALPNFLIMLDKMVIQLFLEIIIKQFREFVKVFLDETHSVLMRTFLVYESETLMFNPSYRELSNMFQEHLDSLFDLFRSFIRPCMIDPKGSGKFLDFKLLRVRLDDIIKADPNFASSYNSLNEMVELAYQEAKETYNSYYTPAMAVFRFKDHWEEMKSKETDPTIYINNLTELTSLQEQITTFKMKYTHQFLICDTKGLRSDLLDILASTIEENNKILFRNFEQICKTIVEEINQIMLTLHDPEDTLEAQAEFNLAIHKALNALPQIDKNVQIVNSIFSRAQECAQLLVPILEASLEEMREAYNRFTVTLEVAQQKLADARAKTIETLVQRQKELEEQMNNLEKKTKAEFSTVEVTLSPEAAIADLNTAIQQTDDLSVEIQKFENTATRLNYSDFDFSQIGRTRSELETNLTNWNAYKDFMNELNSYLESHVMDVDYNKLIAFLNNHNEREMRSANHPLYDKMANAFAEIIQYMPFFQMITKIELNEEHWGEFAKILETSYEKLLDTVLKKFLNPRILSSIDQIKSYVLNLQQRADLSQSFDGMILDMKSLILRLTYSPVSKMKIVTFPSIHEAMNTCEHFVLYLHSLESSPFYATIQQQCEFWMSRLKMSLNILNALLLFQTKFVYFCTATVASFYETHYPHESHALHFITDFYKSFIQQLEFDPHVLSLIPNSEEQLKKEIDRAQSIPPEQIEKFIDQMFKSKNNQGALPYQSATSHPVVNKDLNLPVAVGEIPIYQGDVLIQCFDESRARCEILLGKVSHLLDLHRQNFTRFYYCTDDQILEILLACSNIRYITDDLQPVFPSLSRFHVSIVDSARVMGIINTNGETFQFSRDFDYEHLSVVDLLTRTEKEMQFSVRSTILDALSSREYTETSKWLIRFPVQVIMVAESTHFASSIGDIVHKATTKPNFQPYINEVQEFIKFSNEFLQEFPHKIEQVSSLIAMKLRHRDILSEMNDAESVSADGFEWKQHIFHVVKTEKGSDQIFTQIGPYLIPYGYEMLSKIDICLMTPQEEAAALALASCLMRPELAICKQQNGNRNIVKAFADSCGFPVFDVPASCIRNVFAGASSIHAVIRLQNVKELPAIFPNFFGLIESKNKIMKCENHFREIDRLNWCSLIHIDESEVPNWLKQRLRPIYMNSEPPSLILMRLNQIRREFTFTEDTPIDFATKAIQQEKGIELMETSFSNPEDELVPLKVYFNLPEYLLTCKFITMEQPLKLDIPKYFEEKVTELAEVIEKFEAVSPHSQSPDFPIRPFPLHIVLYSHDRLSTVLTIFSAFRESIRFVRPQLSVISPSKIELAMIGYRPIVFDIIEERTASPLLLVTMPVLTPKMIFDLILQHPEIVNQRDDVLSFANTFVTANRSRAAPELLTILISKMNLIRQVWGSENSIQMTHLAESIFTETYGLASISNEDIMKMPFNYGMSIVISGPVSSGKRTYAKKFIAKYASAQDIILYASPFNETLAITILDNLRFIARGIYGPPDNKKLFLCIFDYQLATPIVKEFVSAFMLHHSVYSKQEESYITVERMQLIITTTNLDHIYSLNTPFYLIDQYESTQVEFDQIPSNELITSEIKAMIAELTTTHRNFALAQKLITSLNTPLNTESYPTETDRFIVLFSLFYSYDDLLKVAESMNLSQMQIKRMQCNNKNIANLTTDIHLCSRMIEVLNMGMSMILVHQDTQIFQFLKNTEFVVLNSHFRTQLFAEMVKVSQNRKRTTFLLNMKALAIPEMFNILDFFLFNVESPESSLIFETADLQIFKHYMDPRGEDRDVLSKLMNLVSFIIICDDKEYETIPDLYKIKMITIRAQDCEDISLKQGEKAPYVDSLLPYVTLDSRTFDERVTLKSKKLRERFHEFIDEVQSVIDFFSTLTSMRNKVENQNVVVSTETEAELKTRMEQLELKIDDAKKKKAELDEDMKIKTNELSVIQAKINVQAPNEVSVSLASLCSFNLDEQVDQINKWLSNRDDEFYIFVNIFKDMFHFITPANFTDTTGNSQFCKLVTSIRQYDLADNNAMISQKLTKLGLKGESPAAAVLEKITFSETDNIPAITSLPLLNAMLAWLSIVVKFCDWQEQLNEVTASLTQIRARNNTNDERLNELQQDYDQAASMCRQKQGAMEVPLWLLNAWNKDDEDVKRFMNQLESATKLLMRYVNLSVEAEKLLSGYAALSVAFKYGFCKLSYSKRKEFLKACKMDHLYTPLDFIDRTVEVELFTPASSLLELLSPDIESPTMQILSYIPIFDQVIFSDIIRQSPRFFRSAIEENGPLIPHPIQVFYDPNDVTLQLIVSNFPEAKIAFTSSKISKHLFEAITEGATLIVHIDSVESGKEFFQTILHFILHINATKRIQFDEANKPINDNFTMFCITKINPKEFEGLVSESDVIFADMAVPNPQDTQWFELINVFSVNSQIEQLFIELLNTLTQKSSDILYGLRKLGDMSHDTWPEYFNNPQKQIALRSLLDSMLTNQEVFDKSAATFRSLTGPNGSHPQAIARYNQYVSLCRKLCDELSNGFSILEQPAYQVIVSVRSYSRSKDRGPMAPLSAINSFQEMLFDVLNCLPCKLRIKFQANFESARLKGIATNSHLLFDSSFPKLSERPLGPLLPQLISHISSRFPTIQRQTFTFVSPESIPFPRERPVIVVVDSMIPTDFFSRSISQHLPQKNLMLLTIGSFSKQGLATPDAFYNIIRGCKNRKALFLVNYDELMPSYTIPAIMHYSHLLHFVNFYIVVNEKLYSSIPLIPAAIVVKVARPYTVSGCARLVTSFPTFRAESMRYEIPLIYLFLLLSHRSDFIVKYNQILPLAQMTRELWSSGQFVNPTARSFWMNVVNTLFQSYTTNTIIHESYKAIFSFFFKENSPQIPGLQRVDFDNDTILSSESPPTPPEIGRVIEEDEENYCGLINNSERPTYGWKKLLKAEIGDDLEFRIGSFDDAKKVIYHAEIINARMNFTTGEISVTGSKYVDISVFEKVQNYEEEDIHNEEEETSSQKKVNPELIDQIPIVDGNKVIGLVEVKRPGNKETWTMAAVKVVLPGLNSTVSVEDEKKE
ncbi:hypothetical protein TRFO_40987 [Tritrichomonas foetus]|uniref:Dynein heavy chain linker domain-containing protein n=1 Tax=Tritrichomonas foetus TaxID=1144522 RepID=A0A1J4J4S9_9EUKA|nr:hypothetical protein TRFO_40987 [Tritrichomonas foetus]|eukprot:OHS92691.1 hypothetical protein TRFO_40987 [Tritrichomonas foetus]